MFWSLLFFTWQANAAPKQVGNYAINFSLPALNPQLTAKQTGAVDVMLSRFVGPVPQIDSSAVILYFYSSTSGVEQLEMLTAVKKKYRSKKNVHFIGICSDRKTEHAGCIGARRVNFPVLHDRFLLVMDRYNIEAFPTLILVDRKGQVFARSKSDAKFLMDDLPDSIDAILEEDKKIYRGK